MNRMKVSVRLGLGLLGLIATAACVASPTAPQTRFATQSFAILGHGYGGYGGYGFYGGGAPYGGFEPYGDYGYGGCGGLGCAGQWGYLGSDLYGGATFLTPSGRIDRQPATLPPGIAEENEEAYRPVGSAIWRRK